MDAIKPPRRQRPEYLHFDRPRCRACGSPHLESYRTLEFSDDCISRRVFCRRCLTKYILVLD